MANEKLTGRETLLAFTGAAIALLLVATSTSFYVHDYRRGILPFILAGLLSFGFFRKRKLALVLSGLSCILALGGVSFPFHPSFSGLVVLLGSAAGFYLAARWSYNKYPYLSYKHTHALFEGEAAMAARTRALRPRRENS